MRFLGQLQWGKYEERNLAEELGVSPDAINMITSEQQANINHEAIHVPSRRNPFRSNEEEKVFFTDLHEVIAQDITPVDFGLTPEEWGSEVYPAVEAILVGRRAAKYIEISLAEPIWYLRARLWCQSLLTLSFHSY